MMSIPSPQLQGDRFLRSDVNQITQTNFSDAVVDACEAVVDAAEPVIDAVVDAAPAVVDAVVDVVCSDGTCGLQAVASE